MGKGRALLIMAYHQWQGFSPSTPPLLLLCSINLRFCDHRCVVFMTDLLISMAVFIIQPKFAAMERTYKQSSNELHQSVSITLWNQIYSITVFMHPWKRPFHFIDWETESKDISNLVLLPWKLIANIPFTVTENERLSENWYILVEMPNLLAAELLQLSPSFVSFPVRHHQYFVAHLWCFRRKWLFYL